MIHAAHVQYTETSAGPNNSTEIGDIKVSTLINVATHETVLVLPTKSYLLGIHEDYNDCAHAHQDGIQGCILQQEAFTEYT